MNCQIERYQIYFKLKIIQLKQNKNYNKCMKNPMNKISMIKREQILQPVKSIIY